MGAKTWMLVYSAGDPRAALARHPALDRNATAALAQRLFPQDQLQPMTDDGSLLYTNPPDNELHIGCFGDVSVVAAREFALDYPSQLPPHFLAAGAAGTITLHAMHSVVDWAAFARWVDGQLIRSLSLSPDSGILEDVGPRLPFEEPYWSGEHPVECDPESEYPFPFHPLELGEAALSALFGYHLEDSAPPPLFEPETIPLMRYARTRSKPRSRWQFWK